MKHNICIDPQPAEVSTGEVKTAHDGVLRASALGSCIAVALYDAQIPAGGVAHLMLPGAAPKAEDETRTKYAEDGLRKLLEDVTSLGARSGSLVACVVGGANVLKREDDRICEANIGSVLGLLEEQGIRSAATEVGGTQRRSLSLDVSSGRVTHTVGGSGPILLWRADGSEQAEGNDNS
jgi:chemotaxis protein CheD